MSDYLDKRLSRLRAEAALNPNVANATRTSSRVGRYAQESMLGNIPQISAMPEAAQQAFTMQQQLGTQQQLADLYTSAADKDIRRREQILQQAEQVEVALAEQKRQEKLQKQGGVRSLVSIGGTLLGGVVGGLLGDVSTGLQIGASAGQIASGLGVGTGGKVDIPYLQAGVSDAINVGMRLAGDTSTKTLISDMQSIYNTEDNDKINEGLLILQQVYSGALNPADGSNMLKSLLEKPPKGITGKPLNREVLPTDIMG